MRRSAGEIELPRLSDRATIAAELDAARRARRAIAPPAELGGLSLHAAYATQDALAACRESGGTTRSGWKLGLTSAVKQRLMGIDHPLFGRIFTDGAVASGGHVARADFIAPRVEPELAFGLSAPLDPSWSAQTFRAAVAWVAPALEVTDSRYLPGVRSAIELVADNTSSAAYVIGQPVPFGSATSLAGIDTQLVRNGTVLAAGMASDVLGDPLRALRLLAEHLAQRGLSTAAGDIILSGAITDAFPASAGDRFEARLRSFDVAGVTFV